MRVASLIDKRIQMVATSFTERSLEEVDRAHKSQCMRYVSRLTS